MTDPRRSSEVDSPLRLALEQALRELRLGDEVEAVAILRRAIARCDEPTDEGESEPSSYRCEGFS